MEDTVIETISTYADAMAPEHLFLARIGLAALLLFAGLYGGRLFHMIVSGIERRVKLSLPQWLHVLVQGFTEPFELSLRILFLYVAALLVPVPQDWTQTIWAWLTPLAKALTVLLVAWGLWRSAPLSRMLLSGAQSTLDIQTNQTICSFFENIYRVVVMAFAVLTVLDMLGVPVASLVAGAGLIGLAVSLAAQSTLTNLIAGITLVLERPFSIGDYIIIGDYLGTVEDISFRSTRIRTPDNIAVTIENTQVCSAYIQNGTKRDSRLWTFTIRLSYDTPLERVEQLCLALRELYLSDPGIKDEPMAITVDEIGDDGIKILVRCYSAMENYYEYLSVRDRLNRETLATMERLGCKMMYPPTSVYMAEE